MEFLVCCVQSLVCPVPSFRYTTARIRSLWLASLASARFARVRLREAQVQSGDRFAPPPLDFFVAYFQGGGLCPCGLGPYGPGPFLYKASKIISTSAPKNRLHCSHAIHTVRLREKRLEFLQGHVIRPAAEEKRPHLQVRFACLPDTALQGFLEGVHRFKVHCALWQGIIHIDQPQRRPPHGV